MAVGKTWIGKCAVCGKTSGYFQRATYEGAPDGGVTVHRDCLGKFYENLEREQWKLEVKMAAPIADEPDEVPFADEPAPRRMGDNREITIIDVFRALKIEPTPEITWAVGNAVRELYKSRNRGELPKKELREKTNAGGTHCFAVYSKSYFSDIEKIIRGYRTEAQRQQEMPF